MKKCPYCAEEIQDEAIKCRYCGEMLAANKDLSIKETSAFEKISTEKNVKQKKVFWGQIARWFGIIICLLAVLPITDEFSKTHSVNRFLFHSLGIFSLIAYAGSLLLQKKQWAWIFFLCCASYFFLYDFVYEVFCLPFSLMAIAIDIGILLRLVLECIILLIGYWGLLNLEITKNTLLNNKG